MAEPVPPSAVRRFLDRHGQTLFNVWLFSTLAIWVGQKTYQNWAANRLDYRELAFTIQNVVMVVLILVRRQHRAVDRNPAHQLVALVAFFSGVFFIGQPMTGGPTAVAVGRTLLVVANVLGIVCLLNLGRNFGILIARREIRTTGLYAVVRHPMYGTDILLRVGYLVGSCTPLLALWFVLSTGCYVYRAILEERFLSQDAAYREYQTRVRYRFIPGVF